MNLLKFLQHFAYLLMYFTVICVFVRPNLPKFKGIRLSKLPTREWIENLASNVGIPTSRSPLFYDTLQTEAEILVEQECEAETTVR